MKLLRAYLVFCKQKPCLAGFCCAVFATVCVLVYTLMLFVWYEPVLSAALVAKPTDSSLVEDVVTGFRVIAYCILPLNSAMFLALAWIFYSARQNERLTEPRT